MKKFKILAINPGSTSTKIGVFEGMNKLDEVVLRHSNEELENYPSLKDQHGFRKGVILEELKKMSYDLKDFDAVACRGGGLKPIESGTYRVTEEVVYDLVNSNLDHPANLAGMIGMELSKEFDLQAFFTDPPSTFEGEERACFSGHKTIKRLLRFHALNQKVTAKTYATDNDLDYNQLNLIVAHVGGGVSVGIHKQGRVVDVNDALEEGPFSPERAGSLPTFQLVDLCFSGQYSQAEIKKQLRGDAGVNAYLGTNDIRDVEQMIKDGSEEAKLVYDAMIYQIAKQIAAVSVNVCGKIDAILLTGGITYSKHFCTEITRMVEFIAPVSVYPGEKELEALTLGALNVLEGKEQPKEY